MEWPYLRHRQKNIYETGAHLWAIFVTRAFPNLINPSVTTHGEFDVTRTSLALNLYPIVVLFCALNQQRRKKQTSFLICIPVIAYSPLRLIITLWVHVCVKRGRTVSVRLSTAVSNSLLSRSRTGVKPWRTSKWPHSRKFIARNHNSNRG